MDNYDWRKEFDREFRFQHQTARAEKEDVMAKFEVILHDDGIFVPQANGLHKLVPDAELGATLRAMANDTARKTRKPRTRKALGKGMEAPTV